MEKSPPMQDVFAAAARIDRRYFENRARMAAGAVVLCCLAMTGTALMDNTAVRILFGLCTLAGLVAGVGAQAAYNQRADETIKSDYLPRPASVDAVRKQMTAPLRMA